MDLPHVDLPAIVWSQRREQRRRQGTVLLFRLYIYTYIYCICDNSRNVFWVNEGSSCLVCVVLKLVTFSR